MPDHVHLLVKLRAGEEAALKALGRFMAGFKRVAAKDAGIRWEEGYHDRICLGREFRGHVEAYLDLNPLKWALMHLPPPVPPYDLRGMLTFPLQDYRYMKFLRYAYHSDLPQWPQPPCSYPPHHRQEYAEP